MEQMRPGWDLGVTWGVEEVGEFGLDLQGIEIQDGVLSKWIT